MLKRLATEGDDEALKQALRPIVSVNLSDEDFASLTDLLANRDPEVRYWAVNALGMQTDSRSFPWLLRLAEFDEDDKVQESAIASLEDFVSPKVFSLLKRLVLNPDTPSDFKHWIAKHLSQYDSNESRRLLLMMWSQTGDLDYILRRRIADSLHIINHESLTDYWFRLMRDEDYALEEVAESALRDLSR